MTNWIQLYHFVLKWIYKFRKNKIDYTELAGHKLGDDCKSLGFVMDSGEEFIHEYNEAYDDTDVLKKVIAKINDTDLLGSAIYSKCSITGHGKESRF